MTAADDPPTSEPEFEAPAAERDWRKARFFCVAFVLVVGAVFACIVRPDALAAATLIPAWCWLAAGCLSIIALGWTRQRWRGSIFILFWVVFTVGWVEEVWSLSRGVYQGISSSAELSGDAVRVVTLNCAGYSAALQDLKRVEPEIVFLQEIPGREDVAKMTRDLFGEEGDFIAGGDTAILARGEVSEELAERGACFVMGTVKFDDDRAVRCVSLRLAPPVFRMDFWSAEFWGDHRAKRERHREQLRQVVEQIDESKEAIPFIVAGDFNAVPLDRALDELRPRFDDAFLTHGTGWGATGTTDWPLFRVDQIWTDENITPLRIHAARTAHSDHKMVVGELAISEH